MSTDDVDGYECEPYSQPQSSVFCGCSLVNENWCNWWEKWTENQNLFLSASLSVCCMELCMGDHHTGATEGNEQFVSVFHIIQQAFCDSLALVNDIRLLKLSCHSQPVCAACGSARWLCLFWDHMQSLYYPQCSFVFAAAADSCRVQKFPSCLKITFTLHTPMWLTTPYSVKDTWMKAGSCQICFYFSDNIRSNWTNHFFLLL